MSFKRILLPVDFSDPAKACHAWAAEKFPGVELVFLHVWWGDEDSYATFHGDPRADAKKELDKYVAEFAKDHDNPTAADVVVGHPATEVCEFAEENDCEMIVMATHGRSGLKHLLVGSVAEAVVRHSAVPVLTMPRS